MKPNFALKLSNDSVELLHRSSGGWLSVGAVRFAHDDIDAGCARLIDLARALAPEGLRSKLIIPDSELKYSTILAPGPTDEARRYQIEAEIERLTPYGLTDLAYDWSVEDDHALVVVCARETLLEAEEFAAGFGFNPVSFVASPESGQFLGEPFFGETATARQMLPADQHVQPDAEPVRIVGKARVPQPATVPGKPAGPAPAAKPASVAMADTLPSARPPQREPETPARMPATTPSAVQSAAAIPAAPIPVMPNAAAPNPAAPTLPAAARGAGFAPRPVVAPPVGPVVAPPQPETTLPPARPAATTPARPAAKTPESLAKVGDLVRRMGTRLRREQAQANADTSSAKPVTAPRPEPAATDSAGPVAFASRRAPPPVAVVSGSPHAVPTRPAGNPGGRLAMLPDARAKAGQVAAIVNRARQSLEAIPARLTRSRDQTAATSARADTDVAAIVPSSRPPTSARDKATEAASMTIFGARGNQRAEPGLARRGLMAAGGLMLLLVAVAVWALYFNGGDPSQMAGVTADPVGSTASAPPAQGIAAPTALTSPEATAAAPIAPEPIRPAPTTLAEATTQAVTEAVTQALTDAATEAVAPRAENVGAGVAAPSGTVAEVVADAVTETLTAALPQTVAPAAVVAPAPVAATPPAPPVATAIADPEALLDTLVQEALNEALPTETLDRASQASEPGTDVSAELPQTADAGTTQRLSLPRGFDVPATAETAFAAPPPPLPFGTEVTLDANGLIEATPDGAITPSGVTVFARRPATAPAPRPRIVVFDPPAVAPAAPVAGAAAETAPTPDVAATALQPPAEVVYDDTPRADPALARARPLPRSERVRALFEQQNPTPPADSGAAAPQNGALETPATTDTATLEAPPPGGVLLAALRPLQRPSDLVPAAAVPEPAPPVDTEGATPEAVALSIRPSARPSDVADRARAALAAASAARGTDGSAEVVEDQQGETASGATAAPAIPSSASVARQATETDAIRLNQVNLIGVFGTPSDRRALVRLSSGRVVRVQVGDRLDGGQVSAIADNELRYVKNGRNEILRIGG